MMNRAINKVDSISRDQLLKDKDTIPSIQKHPVVFSTSYCREYKQVVDIIMKYI